MYKIVGDNMWAVRTWAYRTWTFWKNRNLTYGWAEVACKLIKTEQGNRFSFVKVDFMKHTWNERERDPDWATSVSTLFSSLQCLVLLLPLKNAPGCLHFYFPLHSSQSNLDWWEGLSFGGNLGCSGNYMGNELNSQTRVQTTEAIARVQLPNLYFISGRPP